MAAAPAGDGMSGLKRVAIVVEATPDQRDRVRLGAEACAARGFDVVFYDVSALTRPHVRFNAGTAPDVVRIERRDQLYQLQDGVAACGLVMLHVGFTGSVMRMLVYRALARAACPVLVFAHNAYPGGAAMQPFGRLADLWRRVRALRINPVRSLIARLPPSWMGVRPVDFIVHGGQASLGGARMYPCGPATKRIWAHSADYELFRAERDDGTGKLPMAVFIDENMCFQQDLRDLKITDWITPDEYYPRLCRLFDRIEAATGLEVVIAANPRAEREGRAGLFGARRVEYGKTGNLVAHASLVIAHRSTAVGYAVMAGVPVVLCTVEKLFQHWVNHASYKAFSKALGMDLLFFDDPETADLRGIMNMDALAYARYISDYVKSPDSPDQALWDLVLNAATRKQDQ
jgi:hypothetical protein